MGIMGNQDEVCLHFWNLYRERQLTAKICTTTSRVYVHEDIYEEFLRRFVAEAKSQKIGDPFAQDTTEGAIISKAQYDKILIYIEQGKKSGIRLLAGGVRHGSKG